MKEAEAALSAWKATYGELNPGRDPDAMQHTEVELALLVLLRREIRTRSRPPRGRVPCRLTPYTGNSV